MPSATYKKYEKDCYYFIPKQFGTIDRPINIKAIYYRKTKHRVDLSNLHEALQDILVKYGFLKDDYHAIVRGHDGSRVAFDKKYPRTDVEISFFTKKQLEEEEKGFIDGSAFKE
jgi:Holliday junction resolvase RusA-like endonuclease